MPATALFAQHVHVADIHHGGNLRHAGIRSLDPANQFVDPLCQRRSQSGGQNFHGTPGGRSRVGPVA